MAAHLVFSQLAIWVGRAWLTLTTAAASHCQRSSAAAQPSHSLLLLLPNLCAAPLTCPPAPCSALSMWICCRFNAALLLAGCPPLALHGAGVSAGMHPASVQRLQSLNPLGPKCSVWVEECTPYHSTAFWKHCCSSEGGHVPSCPLLPNPISARGEALARAASPGPREPSSSKRVYRSAEHKLLFPACDFRRFCRLKDLSFSLIQQVGLWWLFQCCSSHGLWDACAEVLCKLNYTAVIARY